MNKYHISYTITVSADNYEEAHELADNIVDFIVEGADEELGIEDVSHWNVECDEDNEEEE